VGITSLREVRVYGCGGRGTRAELTPNTTQSFMTKEYNDYYTYAYLREDKTPYYIGKGRGRRVYSASRLIKPPADRSRILFLKKNLTEEEAFKHEIYMIAILGRKDLGTGILRNLTNGGEGSSGVVISSEQRKAHSEKLRGRTLTKEHKEKISEVKIGENNPQYGRTGALSPRSKAIIAIQPDGAEEHFVSSTEAARKLRMDLSSLCKYAKANQVLKRGKFKGWRFIYKNSEVLT